MKSPAPSSRTGIGVLLILASIVAVATFVALVAPFVGRWPVLIQAAFYLVVGIAWIIPLKPLVRWMLSGGSTNQPE